MRQYFSIIGTNYLFISQSTETKLPTDFQCNVEMIETRPTDTATAQADGTWQA